MKITDKAKRNLVGSSLIGGVLVCIYIAVNPFWAIFHTRPYSNNLHDWNDFGGFFGGTVGVIVAFGNLFAFVILTIKISELEDKRRERESKLKEERSKELAELEERWRRESNEQEEKRHKMAISTQKIIVLSEMRHKSIIDINEKLDDFVTELRKTTTSTEVISLRATIMGQLNSFFMNQYLFNNADFAPSKGLLEAIEKLIIYFNKTYDTNGIISKVEVLTIFNEYLACKKDFIDTLQKSMLNELK